MFPYTVHTVTNKTFSNIEKTPIFATSSRRLRKYDGGVLNDVETAMMEVRWRYFEFSKPVQSPEEINSCAQCFATFILQ